MKRVLLAAALVALMATPLAADVVGTDHDLSSTLSGGPAQVCVFCHTPHNSNQGTDLAGNAPLWNHTLSTNATYGEYTSLTFNATDLADVGSGGYSVSKLCLSCHDGTIAVGSMYNPPNVSGGEATSTAGAITSNANLGTDLSDDHPVNFTYASSVNNGDGELVAEATVASQGLLSGGVGGTVQCSSCHDPHVSGPDAPDLYFMRVTMEQSELCTTCHVK
jgi:predicted CXXCH cytochrome family protein